jgi:membrane protein YqaA with SNARE-associated domain
MEFFAEFGHVGLFVAAFLAATILPLGSEIVLTALLLSGLPAINLVIVATIGNVLGSITNYYLGYWANSRLLKRYLKMSDQDMIDAEQRFKKYGLFSLCFAWVPIIGDPLTVIAGMLRIPFFWFVSLVSLGKLCRYVVIAYLVVNL